MSDGKKYNADAMFEFPLIEDGDADFEPSFTPAAGDIKVFTDKLIATNPTCLILGFDSLSELPAQGAQIDEQGAGTAEGVVAFTVVISGTVGGGDAAGFFFMRSVTGQAWSNNDVIDINGGTANIADADSTTYDLAATAGLMAHIGGGVYAIALSPTEMTCAQGHLRVIDSSTKVVEDQAVIFHTFGNTSALQAMDFDDSVRAGLTALPNFAAGAAGGLPDDTDSNGAVRIVDGTGAREINTNSGAVALVDTVTTLTNKTGFSLVSTGLDLVLVSSTFVAALIKGVWDRVLSGATHNIATSAGRRLRGLQEFQGYEGGAIWIDTVNGTAGTTDFENGTVENPVDSIADANTLATSLGIRRFIIASGTSITFGASQENQQFDGENWTLALGGQAVGGSHFEGATISGTGTGTVSIRKCHLGACSFGGGDFEDCGISDTFTITAATDYHLFNCFHDEAGAPSTIDTGAAVDGVEVHIHDWHGNLLVKNMDTNDILHFSSSNGKLELDSTNTAETANLAGTFGFVDGSSGMTINDLGQMYVLAVDWANGGRLDLLLDAIKVVTDKFVFTVANIVDANVTAISDDTAAAQALEALMDSILTFAVNDASSTTTAFAADGFTEAVDDIFKGRLMSFLTGANQYEQTDISGYDASGGAQGSQEFTVTALTAAPANDVLGVIH